MSDRHIRLEGAYNVRDIGGYLTEDGRTVRWHRLLRGDGTHRLTDDDVASLLDYGLTAVIDLRDAAGVEEAPSVFFSRSEVRYRHVSMHSGDHPVAGSSMAGWYIRLLDNVGTEIAAILLAILEAIRSGCTLIHCSAGKDRTGIVTALLLRSLAVPDTTIVEDYSLSWTYLQPLLDLYRADARERGVDERSVLNGWSAIPETMQELLAHLDRKHGGIGGYFDHIGLPASFSEELRTVLL